MGIFDQAPECSDDSPCEPLQAVIAFSGGQGRGTAIIWGSEELLDDLRENGCDPDDCFLPDKGAGIFVWEGFIHSIIYPSTPNGPEEYDVEYRGTLRELTDQEWACLRAGTNPLAEGSKQDLQA